MLKVIRSAAVVIAALAAGPVGADEKKPGEMPKFMDAPTITPGEAAEGWVMLFDGETTFGWKVEGEAKVENGVLVVGGQKHSKITTTSRFSNLEYRVDLESKGNVQTNFYYAGLPEQPAIKLGGRMRSTGMIYASGRPATPVVLDVPEGTELRVRRFLVRPRGFTFLFNTRDLSGWHMTPDARRTEAKFTVTPAGELHVLGGPGDLQTEAEFDDFVLQTEVKTNGPTVNSGIFFRCVPNQYQNGYEIQIQNGYKDNDRAKPTDFGTGAVYRRAPARKVVSNDKEWFTLTIAADGPHIATWVNGYQVTDWTDTRKPNDNPRQGLRTAAGHISIQGHNPPMAADVLFRNMRIAELKQK